MKITLLGTGAALSDPHRAPTMLAVWPSSAEQEPVWLVDCGSDAARRLMQSGGALSSIHALLFTHEHIDHVCGFPLLMEKLWLSGRRAPLPIYGPAPALAQAQRSFEAFQTAEWSGMPEREPHPVDPLESGIIVADGSLTVRSRWARHSKPVIALRFESGGVSCVYSADTEYCDEVVELARGADLLIHEATGAFPGHSTATDAAQVARRAAVGRLLLVHLPGESDAFRNDLSEAQRIFAATEPGVELGTYDVGRFRG